ncbi:MAG: OmpA family protein [Gammaproteobacteria bacterium]
MNTGIDFNFLGPVVHTAAQGQLNGPVSAFPKTGSRRICRHLLIILSSLFLNAHAGGGDLYIGGGPSFSFLDPETSGTSFSVDDDTDIGGKVFVGYDFTDRWSLEGFFAIPGEAGIAPSGTIEYDSLGGLGAAFSWPHNKQGLSGFLKGGGSVLDTSSSDVPFRQEEDIQPFGGAGLRYGFCRGWGARLELEYFFEDLQMITLSAVKRFGLGKKAMPVAAAAQPEPAPETQAAPEPQMPAAEPKTPVYEGTLPSVLFALNSAELDETARNRLDAVVEILHRSPTLRLAVVGHTCDVGTEAHNQGLSERRAQSAFDYLVEKGAPRDRLQASGMGELQPTASNATAKGRTRNRRCEFEVQSR